MRWPLYFVSVALNSHYHQFHYDDANVVQPLNRQVRF